MTHKKIPIKVENIILAQVLTLGLFHQVEELHPILVLVSNLLLVQVHIIEELISELLMEAI